MAAPSAARARGPGPSGFSLEASLMLPLMPSSRSSVAVGLPGRYGERLRTPGAASAANRFGASTLYGPGAQYAVDGPDPLDEARGDLAVDVDQRVGELALRLVEQVRDVEAGVGEARR